MQICGIYFFQFFAQYLRGVAEFFGSMAGGDKEAEPGGAFLDGGVKDGHDVHSPGEHGPGKHEAVLGIAQYNGNYGGILAGAGVQPALFAEIQEEGRIFVQADKALGLFNEQLDGGQGGGGGRGSNARSEHEAGRGVAEIIDQGFATGDISAATSEGLA